MGVMLKSYKPSLKLSKQTIFSKIIMDRDLSIQKKTYSYQSKLTIGYYFTLGPNSISCKNFVDYDVILGAYSKNDIYFWGK